MGKSVKDSASERVASPNRVNGFGLKTLDMLRLAIVYDVAAVLAVRDESRFDELTELGCAFIEILQVEEVTNLIRVAENDIAELF